MSLHCVRLTEPPPIQQHQQQQKRQQQQKLIFHVPMTPGGLDRETATNGAATTTSIPGGRQRGGRGVRSGQPCLHSLRRRGEFPQWIEWRGNLLYWRDYYYSDRDGSLISWCLVVITWIYVVIVSVVESYKKITFYKITTKHLTLTLNLGLKFSSTHCSNQEDEEPSSNKPVRKSKKSPRGASKSPEKRASRSPTKGRKKKPSRLDPQGKFFKNSMNT